MYRKNTKINISNMVTMTNKKLIDSAHAKQSSRCDYEKFIVTVHLCSYGYCRKYFKETELWYWYVPKVKTDS